MQLSVAGSGSSGNCYILTPESGTDRLVLEAGIKYEKMVKYIGHSPRSVSGVFVSHKHNDHAGHAISYCKNGLRVYIDEEAVSHFNMSPVKHGSVFELGPWTVKAFSLEHDVPCYGYLVHHKEIGIMPFITDTHYIPYKFSNIGNIMIEANYSNDILIEKSNSGKIHQSLANRISMSHSSLQTAIDFLEKNDISHVRNIVLIHLSESNSDVRMFTESVQKATGIPTHIAIKNTTIRL